MKLTTTNTRNVHTKFSSLKTRAGAVARLEKVLSAASLDSLGCFNYIIASNDDGTFAPVVLLKDHQQWVAAALAERGVVVVG